MTLLSHDVITLSRLPSLLDYYFRVQKVKHPTTTKNYEPTLIMSSHARLLLFLIVSSFQFRLHSMAKIITTIVEGILIKLEAIFT